MGDRVLISLVEAIINSAPFQALWRISDRGMPVFAHTVDVTLLALEAFPDWRERFPDMNLRPVVVASLLHDVDKLDGKQAGQPSHSEVMSTEPARALNGALDVLRTAHWQVGVSLSATEVDHIWHVVVSHHGRWGKIQPQTPEAALVHRCDLLSATRHRLAPIDAADVLRLLDEGRSWSEAAVELGVTVGVIRDRLRESCRAEQVADPVQLLGIWRSRGYVVTGTLARMRQFEEARAVVEEARRAPTNIVSRLRGLSPSKRLSK